MIEACEKTMVIRSDTHWANSDSYQNPKLITMIGDILGTRLENLVPHIMYIGNDSRLLDAIVDVDTLINRITK